MSRNRYLDGIDVLGQLVTPPPPVALSPAQASALASQQQLAATKAALAQVKAQRLASSQAFAAQLAQSAAADFAVSQSSTSTPSSTAAPTNDDTHGGGSRAADVKSGYLSGTDVIIDVLGAISAPRMSSFHAPVGLKTPTRSLPTMSSGIKTITSSTGGAGGHTLPKGIIYAPPPASSSVKTIAPVHLPPGGTLASLSTAVAVATALGPYKASGSVPSDVWAAIQAAHPGATLPAGMTIGAPTTGTATGTYQIPTAGLPPTSENPNDPTHLMNGQLNPNPPNPGMPGFLMNGQPDPYAPNPMNPYTLNNGMANPNPPNPSNPMLLTSGAINPFYSQETAAGGIPPTNPYGASSQYGGDTGGGGYSGDDSGVDWGDGSDDGSGDGSDDGSDDNVDWGDGSDDGSDDQSGGMDMSQMSMMPQMMPGYGMMPGMGMPMMPGFGGGYGGGYDPSQGDGSGDDGNIEDVDGQQVDWGQDIVGSYLAGNDILGASASGAKSKRSFRRQMQVLGMIDIGAEQLKMNALKPVTLTIARTLVKHGLDVIGQAISLANASNLPGPTARTNCQAHIQWHQSKLAGLSSPPDSTIYDSSDDLKKWVQQAAIEFNSVQEGSAYLEAQWDAMWDEIGEGLKKVPVQLAKLPGQAIEAVTGIPWWLVYTGGAVVVGGVIYGAYKVATSEAGSRIIGGYLGGRR